ncbi:hypothetical protein QQX98_010312 [Neonectria punicea]|uniref:Uncharacterized protein n=1 Tax=Neonectria punicea TaxID=979145 RepID=A0ABR1GQ40_9HYPO
MADQLVVNLLEEPIDEGEFRTKNNVNEKFRPVLVDRGDQLVTKVAIVGITHGELAESDDLATILTFEFRFVATGGRRFKSASVMFTFEDSEGDTSQDPVVHDISPNGQWALNKTEKVQNVKYGANVGINGGIDLAGAEAGLLWELGEVKSRDFFTKLTGVKRIMRRGFVGEENVVIWTLEENEDKETGIPTLMRAAVLLRRPYDVPFTFTVKVRADVDFIGTVKTLFGMERKDPIDPVEVDSGRNMKALDPKRHNLKEMDSLDLQKVGGVTVVTTLDGRDLH